MIEVQILNKYGVKNMKKELIRIVSLLLVMLMSITLLVACKSEGGNEGDTTTEGTTPIPEVDDLKLIDGGVFQYTIVYKKYPDELTKSAVADIAKAFKDACGITVSSMTADKFEGNGKRILVGRMDDPKSASAYENIKYHAYSVTIDGDDIVIASHTDKGYERIIKWLSENVFTTISGEGAGMTMTMKAENFSGTTKKNYSVDSWTINGVDLAKYKIVYSGSSMLDIANEIRDTIATNTGYYLEVVLDIRSPAQPYEIVVGETNRPGYDSIPTPAPLHFSATVIDGKLMFKCGGSHSMSRAGSKIVSLAAAGSNNIEMVDGYTATGDLYDDTYDSSKPADSNVRVMSCNILAEYESWSAGSKVPVTPVGMRKEIFFATLDYYQPTLIGLQELSPEWYRVIPEYSDFDKWDLLKFQNPNKTNTEYVFSTIMYRKDLYTLLDSGMEFYSVHNNARCRCYTWALLQDKVSGQKFCFVSTHWDGGDGSKNTPIQVDEISAFVNEMQKQYPVFTTGDFNRNELTDEFKQYLERTEMVDGKYAAVNQVNNIGSWHEFGLLEVSWGSCDHITATKDTTILKFQTLMYNEQIYCSDHAWMIADIKFNK